MVCKNVITTLTGFTREYLLCWEIWSEHTFYFYSDVLTLLRILFFEIWLHQQKKLKSISQDIRTKLYLLTRSAKQNCISFTSLQSSSGLMWKNSLERVWFDNESMHDTQHIFLSHLSHLFIMFQTLLFYIFQVSHLCWLEKQCMVEKNMLNMSYLLKEMEAKSNKFHRKVFIKISINNSKH